VYPGPERRFLFVNAACGVVGFAITAFAVTIAGYGIVESVPCALCPKEVVMSSIHLIRFKDRKSRLRAIEAFLEVRQARVMFPERVMGVTDEHIKALQQAVPPIDFEYVSQPPANGQEATSV
jgi:hypothetical protein